MSKEIMCIGQNDNVDLFRTLGFEVHKASDKESLKAIFTQLEPNVRIIYYDEKLEDLMTDFKEKIQNQAYPILVALPLDGNISHLGTEKLRSDVEKAIGIKII